MFEEKKKNLSLKLPYERLANMKIFFFNVALLETGNNYTYVILKKFIRGIP